MHIEMKYKMSGHYHSLCHTVYPVPENSLNGNGQITATIINFSVNITLSETSPCKMSYHDHFLCHNQYHYHA